MIAIVSPAKNMRTASLKGLELTRPALLEKTRRLLPMLRALEPWELESRLKINPQLAMKAFSDFQEFESPGGESPALLSYHGLAYQNLEAESLGLEDFALPALALGNVRAQTDKVADTPALVIHGTDRHLLGKDVAILAPVPQFATPVPHREQCLPKRLIKRAVLMPGFE